MKYDGIVYFVLLHSRGIVIVMCTDYRSGGGVDGEEGGRERERLGEAPEGGGEGDGGREVRPN